MSETSSDLDHRQTHGQSHRLIRNGVSHTMVLNCLLQSIAAGRRLPAPALGGVRLVSRAAAGKVTGEVAWPLLEAH